MLIERATGKRSLAAMERVSAATLPPCRSTRRFTTASPMPSPPLLTASSVCSCANSWNTRGIISALDRTVTVETGKCIALMGPSGSGKSTLAKLLQGFYQPQEGAILLDGAFNLSFFVTALATLQCTDGGFAAVQQRGQRLSHAGVIGVEPRRLARGRLGAPGGGPVRAPRRSLGDRRAAARGR